MMSRPKSLDEILNSALTFVKQYGNLGSEEKPILSIPYQKGRTTIHPNKALYHGDDRVGFPTVLKCDRIEDIARQITTKLETKTVQAVHDMVVDNFVDDDDHILVRSGYVVTDEFLRRFVDVHSNTTIYIVSEINLTAFKKMSGRRQLSLPSFEKTVTLNDDIEETINNLFKANGYSNVTFVNVYGNPRRLKGVLADEREKKFTYLALNNTPRLGHLVLEEAKRSSGLVYASFDDVKSLKTGDSALADFEFYLGIHGLKENERVKFIKLLKSAKDYSNSTMGPWMFGIMLKLCFSAAMARGLQDNDYSVGLLMEDKDKEGVKMLYDNASTIVYAFK